MARLIAPNGRVGEGTQRCVRRKRRRQTPARDRLALECGCMERIGCPLNCEAPLPPPNLRQPPRSLITRQSRIGHGNEHTRAQRNYRCLRRHRVHCRNSASDSGSRCRRFRKGRRSGRGAREVEMRWEATPNRHALVFGTWAFVVTRHYLGVHRVEGEAINVLCRNRARRPRPDTLN